MAAVENILCSLETIAEGSQLSQHLIGVVNGTWSTLADADYSGKIRSTYAIPLSNFYCFWKFVFIFEYFSLILFLRLINLN